MTKRTELSIALICIMSMCQLFTSIKKRICGKNTHLFHVLCSILVYSIVIRHNPLQSFDTNTQVIWQEQQNTVIWLQSSDTKAYLISRYNSACMSTQPEVKKQLTYKVNHAFTLGDRIWVTFTSNIPALSLTSQSKLLDTLQKWKRCLYVNNYRITYF